MWICRNIQLKYGYVSIYLVFTMYIYIYRQYVHVLLSDINQPTNLSSWKEKIVFLRKTKRWKRTSWIKMDVSENSGTPKSSIWIGFSIINHPFWGPTPIFGNTQICWVKCPSSPGISDWTLQLRGGKGIHFFQGAVFFWVLKNGHWIFRGWIAFLPIGSMGRKV